jgi:hypothetical protein
MDRRSKYARRRAASEAGQGARSRSKVACDAAGRPRPTELAAHCLRAPLRMRWPRATSTIRASALTLSPIWKAASPASLRSPATRCAVLGSEMPSIYP